MADGEQLTLSGLGLTVLTLFKALQIVKLQ
jgi:hypothetical protein